MILRIFITTYIAGILAMLLIPSRIETNNIIITIPTAIFMISALVGGLYLSNNLLKSKKNLSKFNYLLYKSAPISLPISILIIRQISN